MLLSPPTVSDICKMLSDIFDTTILPCSHGTMPLHVYLRDSHPCDPPFAVIVGIDKQLFMPPRVIIDPFQNQTETHANSGDPTNAH